MSFYPSFLLDKLNLEYPLIGTYDTPDVPSDNSIVTAKSGQRACIFSFFDNWQKGEILKLTKDNLGCPGCSYWIFNTEKRPRDKFIQFLVDSEGLKASHELMDLWLKTTKPYTPEFDFILIGPLQDKQYKYLKTITFYVNPDQLSILTLAAQYYSTPADLTPVIAPFGSGCMQLLPLFKDLQQPQALIGATDLAMRKHLPPDILAFTITKPLFELFCKLDEKSFLDKPFLKNLNKARFSVPS